MATGRRSLASDQWRVASRQKPKKEKKMSKETFEHKDELDCEVTVFKGAHTTCEKNENDSAETAASKKTNRGEENMPPKI